MNILSIFVAELLVILVGRFINQLRLLLILVTCYIITNLRIATYNSRGHGVDRINYIQSLMLHNDVVLIQEHWYNDANINQLESLISGISVIGISGMKEDELLFGRPYGGCAILYNNLVKCTVSPISYESKRCMGCVIRLNNIDYLLINVYMPCDTRAAEADPAYEQLLHDIDYFIQLKPECDYVIIGGDFNTDISRVRSAHSIALNEFCERP